MPSHDVLSTKNESQHKETETNEYFGTTAPPAGYKSS